MKTTGVYPLCDKSFRWDVFCLIKYIKKYFCGMKIEIDTSLNSNFNYGYLYSIKFTFLRPSKAIESVASHSGFQPSVCLMYMGPLILCICFCIGFSLPCHVLGRHVAC